MIQINRHTLDNGLRIVHHHRPDDPMMAMNIIYDVGARDENPSMTGLAHLFEHLMFGGSVNIPDFDAATEAAGGTNNAWTNNDYTSFHCLFPAVNAETPFWLESDRMLSLAFSERSLEVQRNVVIEEFKQTCLDQPYGDFYHHLRKLVYRVHPYRVPTIGATPDDLRRVTLDDVKRFFFSHYAPNNAVVAVAGGISFERTVELAERWFGPIARRDIAPRSYQPEPEVTEPRSGSVENPDLPDTILTLAYPMGGIHSADYIPADLLTDILASGRSSRFYRRLMLATDLFTEVDASIEGSVEPGMLMVNARLRESTRMAVDDAIEAITLQLREIAAEGPTIRETERAHNRFVSNRIFSNLTTLALTQNLAQDEINGFDFNEIPALYRATGANAIADAAHRIFDPRRQIRFTYGPGLRS